MRLRKIKYAKSMIELYPQAVIEKPEEFAGKWQTLFQNDFPIHLEIGCGKGQFIHSMAKKHPQINFIAMEKYDSVIIRALDKWIQEPMDHLRFIQKDANHLDLFFGKEEISTIYLNFSDPWPKLRQAKRRLTHPLFLERYLHVLKPNGKIILKTDNFGLFQYSMMTILNHPNLHLDAIDLDYQDQGNVTTEFEDKFRELGNPIYHLLVSVRKG